MKTTLLILAFAAFTVSSTLRADEPAHPPINPALLYWQAAALLPNLTEDQVKDLRAMAGGAVPFDATKAKDVIADEWCLHLLQKAANSTAPCSWGLPTEDGPQTALPHVSKMQELSSVAILKARNLFAEGKNREGLDWLFVAHRMARHTGVDEMLVPNLVQFHIEGAALHAAARHCLSWDAETRHTYATMLQSLPPLHTTQAAYRGENLFIDWIENKLGTAQSKAEAENLLRSVSNGIPEKDIEGLEADLSAGAIPGAVAEMRERLSQVEDAAGKPWPQANAESQKITEEVAHSSHYLVRLFFPSVMNVIRTQYVIATLRTMLDAALEHGPQLDETAAATHHDAFTGEPLKLQKAADGTLTLAMAHDYQPGNNVTMQFGK